MRSSVGIDIAAPADLVFRLARDVERWPDLLPHYAAASRLGGPDAEGRLLVAFVARRRVVRVLGLGLPVAWRSLTWSEADGRRLRFVHRGGATNGMDVTWRIESRPDGITHVNIEHVFRPRVPGWAWLIDRLVTRSVAGQTLASFRAIAESVAGPAGPSVAGPAHPSVAAGDRSTAADPTNPPA